MPVATIIVLSPVPHAFQCFSSLGLKTTWNIEMYSRPLPLRRVFFKYIFVLQNVLNANWLYGRDTIDIYKLFPLHIL